MTRVDRSRLPGVGADPPFSFPRIERHTLDTGLQVRTVEHHGVPVVTFVLQIAGGSGVEPAGREGLAAIVADMADEGTGTLSALDVSDALARIGGDYEAQVGGDATMFSLTTLTRFADRGASLLADMVARPSLREADFDRVRQLRLDRLRQLRDLPSAVAEQTMLRLLYGPHPYGHLSIGSDRALRGIGLDDVSGLHRQVFRPSAATLVVCGAASHQALLECARSAFGGWHDGDEPADRPMAAGVAVPDLDRPALAVVAREGAAQSELRIGQLTTTRNTPHYPALLVMNALLGGQFVSRVNLKLREEKGYTYGARTGFDWRRGLSPFVLQTSVDTAATTDAIACSLAEIDGIRGSRPPTPEELSLAKASLTRGYPRGFETVQQVARSVAQLALYELPDGYFAEFVPRVNAVAADDVVAAASTHLDPATLTTLVVGDHTAFGDALGGLNLGQFRMVPNEL